jgi:hypothetical protein
VTDKQICEMQCSRPELLARIKELEAEIDRLEDIILDMREESELE